MKVLHGGKNSLKCEFHWRFAIRNVYALLFVDYNFLPTCDLMTRQIGIHNFILSMKNNNNNNSVLSALSTNKRTPIEMRKLMHAINSIGK